MSRTISLWQGAAPPILASASNIRAQILMAAGLACDVRPASVDERTVEAGLADRSPGAVARALSAAKALSVSAVNPARITIGADQTLDCDGDALHKPVDRANAAAQLARLAGKRHRLTSAAAIACDGVVLGSVCAEAWLTMRAMRPDEINAYLDLAGPAALGSVGSYQFEALGAHLFEAVEGDQFTIMGLPLLPLLGEMRRLGLIAFATAHGT